MEHKQPPLKAGDIYPAHVLRDEYGFNAENRPTIKVNPIEVPEHLLLLIPFVERWGIPCDVTRGDYFDKQPKEDIAEFYNAVLPFKAAANQWLDSLPEDVVEWPEAGVQLMYMLKAHGEAYQPTPEEIAEREARFAQTRDRIQREKAIEEAMTMFKARNYGLVVELLMPYQESLSETEKAKLRYAQKNKSGG
jgi:hypothetical protein